MKSIFEKALERICPDCQKTLKFCTCDYPTWLSEKERKWLKSIRHSAASGNLRKLVNEMYKQEPIEDMPLDVFTEIINQKVEVNIDYVGTLPYKYRCSFVNHCEIKADGMLYGVMGYSKRSAEESVQSFIEIIKGKTIVFNAYSSDRQEFTVPKNLKMPIYHIL